jgi:hypothetical protein
MAAAPLVWHMLSSNGCLAVDIVPAGQPKRCLELTLPARGNASPHAGGRPVGEASPARQVHYAS